MKFIKNEKELESLILEKFKEENKKRNIKLNDNEVKRQSKERSDLLFVKLKEGKTVSVLGEDIFLESRF